MRDWAWYSPGAAVVVAGYSPGNIRGNPTALSEQRCPIPSWSSSLPPCLKSGGIAHTEQYGATVEQVSTACNEY